MERVLFVGPGRVGLAMGHALAHCGPEVQIVYYGRRPEPPGHPLFYQGLAEYRYGIERPATGTSAVFLTVPDAVLPEIAAAVAARGEAPPGCAAFHTSGAMGADPLAPLHARGYAVGTMHPFQSIADPLTGADRLPGSFFAISGEPLALAAARRLISLLGGVGLSVPTSRRPVYHAAAVFASNYLIVLLREAVRLLEQSGASEDDAERAIIALARGTLDNVAKLGLDRALTGPLVRGDVETVELHLRALGGSDAVLYSALGRTGLDWVRERLSPEAIARLEELFERTS